MLVGFILDYFEFFVIFISTHSVELFSFMTIWVKRKEVIVVNMQERGKIKLELPSFYHENLSSSKIKQLVF